MKPDVATNGPRVPFTLSDLEYELPAGLIAQHPLPRRDGSRMLVLERSTGALRDRRVTELPELLRRGDLLVLNDTKVLPAKFCARRQTGGKVNGLFIGEKHTGYWRVILESSGRLRAGEALNITGIQGGKVLLRLDESCGAGHWRVRVEPAAAAEELLDRIGWTPLPPYIRRDDDDPSADREDRARYQTVYARRLGAIAAPTAGLHLTEVLLDRIRERGVQVAWVTLHVGVGTFCPIRVTEISRHVMHAERYELNKETAEAVNRCRQQGGRVVAVGTTDVRVLESAATGPLDAPTVRPSSGETDLFIYPPYRFRTVDLLLTNFHLPGSTLLALVMALGGVDNVRRAYQHAIKKQYRFYSYGDAMLIR